MTLSPQAALPALELSAARLTFCRLVCSELIKLWSLRAILGSALTLVGCSVGLAGLVASAVQSEGNTDAPGLATALTVTTSQLVVQTLTVILGCLSVSIEYSSGAIRSSLTAAPRRWSLLGAKTVAAALVLALALALAVGLGFATMFGIFRLRGFGVVCAAADLGTLVGLVGYGVILGLFGFLFGFLTRSAVGGIGAGLGLTLILPLLLALASGRRWVDRLAAALPEQAAHRLVSADGSSDLAGGLAVALVWLAAAFIVTGVLFQRRDA
jgi:ABC-2 type transport system permease protein